MPYLEIRCLAKTDEFKKQAAEKLNQAVLDIWGCAPEAITISFEEYPTREEFAEKVKKPIFEANKDKMYIRSGVRTDKML